DGIRDLIVTGVQTCALPICALLPLIAFVGWTLNEQRLETRRHVVEEAHDAALHVRDAVDSHLHFVEGVLASVAALAARGEKLEQIGRASCRERGWCGGAGGP